MEYIYAALLLHKAGKNVDENGVKAVLTAAGVKVDESRVRHRRSTRWRKH